VSERISTLRSLSGRNVAVAASALVVLVAGLAIGIGWLASDRSSTTTYSVPGSLTRVDLVLSSGQATIVGSSSSTLQVRRVDDYAFGRAALEQRSMSGGVLRISSRCPKIVLGSCSASYELEVPQSVAVNVQTRDGDVRMTGFSGNAALVTHSGNVDVEAYCGFNLSARSGVGNLHVATACAPQHLDLISGSGDAVALVPPGHYRIAASSGSGRQSVSGLVRDHNALFTIDVHSSTGTVAVEGGL
jgi:hypothetical protein